jgi:hypothetical protein
MVFADVSCQESLGELKSESLCATSTTLNNVRLQGSHDAGRLFVGRGALSLLCSHVDLSICRFTRDAKVRLLIMDIGPMVPAFVSFGDGSTFAFLLQMISYTYSNSSCLCEIHYQ